MITTYAELQTAVINWTKRPDLATLVPDFIALAEERIWARLRSKALTKDLAQAYLAAATTVDLPSDCISIISLVDTASGRSGMVEVVSPDRLAQLRVNTYEMDTSKTYLMSTGRQLVFVTAPSVGGTISGRYLAREPALSNTNTTNQVLSWYPSLYLFGALIELADHTRDEDGEQKYSARFNAAMNDANSQAAYLGERAYRAPDMTVV